MDALTDSWTYELSSKICRLKNSDGGGGGNSLHLGLLCAVLLALEFLRRAAGAVAGMVRASNAGSQPAGNAVERRRVQHPSVARQLAADARMAAEVSQGLKDAADSAADSASDDEGDEPLDVDAVRRRTAARLSPNTAPLPPSPSKGRATGGLRGFTSTRPLHFDAEFDRSVDRCPTDFWLAKFALTHREEFEKLVAETATDIHDHAHPDTPLDLLAADVETLSSSLDGLRRLQNARPTLAVAPTPVKAALAPTKGSSSPPVSPLLRFEEEEAAAGAKALCN